MWNNMHDRKAIPGLLCNKCRIVNRLSNWIYLTILKTNLLVKMLCNASVVKILEVFITWCLGCLHWKLLFWCHITIQFEAPWNPNTPPPPLPITLMCASMLHEFWGRFHAMFNQTLLKCLPKRVLPTCFSEICVRVSWDIIFGSGRIPLTYIWS